MGEVQEVAKVTFSALMKSLQIKSLVSGDKGGRLLLEFRADDAELVSGLNEIMSAEDEVKVTVER